MFYIIKYDTEEVRKKMSSLIAENGKFLLDGNPFRILSGAMHYFRVLPEQWETRLKKLKPIFKKGSGCTEKKERPTSSANSMAIMVKLRSD